MPITDFFLRLRLVLYGVSIALIALGTLVGTAPYWLKWSETYQKSEIGVLDGTEIPNRKSMKAIATLIQKGEIRKLIVFTNKEKSDSVVLKENSSEEIIATLFLNFGVPVSQMEVVPLALSGKVDIQEMAKRFLKIAVSDNHKSVLVVSPALSGRRTYLTFEKILEPANVSVFIYSLPSDYGVSNWFQTEKGILEVTKELARYINARLRGAY